MDIEVTVQSEREGSEVLRFSVAGPFIIGRNEQCLLRLRGDLVSRHHAIVTAHEGGLTVRDVSSNGTIAGPSVLHGEETDVPHGTPLVVGDYRIVIRPGDDAPSALRPSPADAPILPPTAPPPAFHPAGTNGVAIPGANGRAVTAANGVAATPPNGLVVAPPSDVVHLVAPARAIEPSIIVVAPPAPSPPSPSPSPPAPPTSSSATEPPAVAASEAEGAAAGTYADAAIRREIHRRLLDYLDLAKLDANKLDDPSTRPRVLAGLRKIIQNFDDRLPPAVDRDGLLGELADEALGLGPLERFLDDPTVSEVMVVDANSIYIESRGRLIRTNARFTDDERVRAAIERIVTPLGRRIDESSPLVDARLKDGSRVNAIIRPLAIKGSCITIRKFGRVPLTLDKLIDFGTLDPRMARFLTRCVAAKKNMVISGGTGSGKTTLLNVLSGAIPPAERIVTIEDAAELRLTQPHVVSLEARPANMEGKGQYTIRDLVVNALRMRPDRIVVGECRGGEALDMLQAMNTGHDGSLTTTHANSPIEAMARLETLCLMSGLDLPARAIREQIATSIDVVVQQTRFADGSRRISDIAEVVGLGDEGEIQVRSLFAFVRSGIEADGRITGDFRATGYLPSFLNQFIVLGLVKPGEPYL